ncbi:hypothetical protein PR048_017805 [Dryococelus australis]|uniref:HTH psq-type domain-containing protein n=1 Tax=Dryococelus australis TaxID=614101 RepID=A0ABQ9HAL9_9NEOP|nr:hypothetical protein PR048_017805 [Dryococelus australis]
MLCVYKRKQDASPRGLQTEEASSDAIRRYKASDIGLREAARYYGVPARTLVWRIVSGNNFKRGLGPEVAHIQHLTTAGFAPDGQTFRRLTYQFAEKLGLKHKFFHITKMAGCAWLSSFLESNPEITVWQAEGLSLSRSQCSSRSEVDAFFKLLKQIMMEENLMEKPQNIFNMVESGIQLTNKPGKDFFYQRGQVYSCVDSSHTTHALQPLYRSFMGPLKAYYNNGAKLWLQQHDRNITRYQAGYIMGNALNKAASVVNTVAGFKATGIFHLNPDIIPEHFYGISDASVSTFATITPL